MAVPAALALAGAGITAVGGIVGKVADAVASNKRENTKQDADMTVALRSLSLQEKELEKDVDKFKLGKQLEYDHDFRKYTLDKQLECQKFTMEMCERLENEREKRGNEHKLELVKLACTREKNQKKQDLKQKKLENERQKHKDKHERKQKSLEYEHREYMLDWVLQQQDLELRREKLKKKQEELPLKYKVKLELGKDKIREDKKKRRAKRKRQRSESQMKYCMESLLAKSNNANPIELAQAMLLIQNNFKDVSDGDDDSDED